MKIWCDVQVEMEGDAIGLWIQIELLAIVPIGTSIELPIPKAWEDYGDWIFGHIIDYHVEDGQITCRIYADFCISDKEMLQELLDVGYLKDTNTPPEVEEGRLKSRR